MAQNIDKDFFKENIFNFETETEFKYKGELPCIIDFYADWCAPCKMVAPILEELSETYKGKINIYKVDTEKEQELSAVFKIRSIPTLLFIPKNDKLQIVAGALSKEDFKRAIKDILKVE